MLIYPVGAPAGINFKVRPIEDTDVTDLPRNCCQRAGLKRIGREVVRDGVASASARLFLPSRSRISFKT